MEVYVRFPWKNWLPILFCFVMFFLSVDVAKQKVNLLTQFSDPKEFKKFVRTHINVLVLFVKAESDLAEFDMYIDVALQMKGLASIIYIDCRVDKKLCRKLKCSLDTFEVKHFKDGEFHKNYDRKLTAKSLINFLRDPTGEIPWEEDSSALDVLHVDTRVTLIKFLSKEKKPILLMFYAPWCGYCKRLKPEYASAATDLKGSAILAGMDVDRPENMVVRTEYNITGFPTVVYFENGQLLYRYGGEHTRDGIVKWMRNPEPPKEPEKEEDWSETESDVVHLTDSTFDEHLATTSSVLVMFYAPWCGHCKKMKPEYVDAATKLKADKIECSLAAIDATKEQVIGGRYGIKGYPTVKYFKDGKELWDVPERTTDKIIEFMKDPKEPAAPPPSEAAWEDVESSIEHLGEETFKAFIKKKKHTIVMFYAPWCGHCKKAKPEFTAAAEYFKADTKVAFAAVDCTKHTALCGSQDVPGYPTFKYFNYGKNDQKYTGGREEADFINFMKDPLNPLSSAPATPPAGKSWSDFDGHENVRQLTIADFDTTLKDHKSVLVMFYAPWCGHCTSMKPAYVEAATIMKAANVDGVLAAVDVTTEQIIGTRFNIKGFPTIKYFANGVEAFEYNKGRRTEEFVAFMKNPVAKEEAPVEAPWSDEPSHVHYLTGPAMVKDFLASKQKVLVMFYAPWCPHCKAAKPNLVTAAHRLKEWKDIFVAAIDCTVLKEVCQNLGVKGYPAFHYFKNGKSVAEYSGDRTADDLVKFITTPPPPEPKEEPQAPKKKKVPTATLR